MYGVIYLIENLCNGKVYVGLTTRGVSKRFEEHCVTDSYLGRAIRKHGRDNFRISVIDHADDHFDLCEKEKMWIKRYKAFGEGYNLTHGGDGVVMTKFIENEYTELQQRFLKQCAKERHDELDVNNKHQMIRMCLMYTLEAFLISDTEKNKKEVAKMLFRLRPEYFKSVMDSKIISLKDLKQWV